MFKFIMNENTSSITTMVLDEMEEPIELYSGTGK